MSDRIIDLSFSVFLFLFLLLISAFTYHYNGSKYIPIVVVAIVIVNLFIIAYIIKQSIHNSSKIKIKEQTIDEILSEQKHDFSVIITISGIIFGFSSLILISIFPEEIDKVMDIHLSISYIFIFIGTIYSIGSIAICLFDLFVRSFGSTFNQPRKTIDRIVILQYINRNATLWALLALIITLIGLVAYFTQGFEILRFMSDPITDGTITWPDE